MPADPELAPGLCESLLALGLAESLDRQQALKAALSKLDDEEAPKIKLRFVSRLVAEALRSSKPGDRLPLANRLVGLVAAADGFGYLSTNKLVDQSEKLVLALQAPLPEGSVAPLHRPEPPLSISSLLTGALYDAVTGE